MTTVSRRSAIRAEEAARLVPDGASVMIGGFLGVGTPERLVDALVARQARNLTVIANDTAKPGLGIGKLIDAGCIARADRLPYRDEPRDAARMLEGAMAVELVPRERLPSGSAPAASGSAAS